MSKFEEKIDLKNLSGRFLKCVNLVNPEDKEILDIGCSFGWYENYALVHNCKRIVGLEPDQKKIARARREVPKATFVEGEALVLPFGDSEFDLVTMFDVLEHLPKNSESATLREVYRVLRADGKLVISTPLSNFLANLLDPAWYLGHRHYTQDKLEKLLENVDFQIERIEFGGGFFEEVSLLVFYFYNRMLKTNPPAWGWLTERARKEWDKNFKGTMSIFVVAKKPC